ncbi:hypothetical protein ABE288_20890 [Bacillus salipaludis]
MGMMVVQPEDQKEIKELIEWLENYPFQQQSYILPLSEHLIFPVSNLYE